MPCAPSLRFGDGRRGSSSPADCSSEAGEVMSGVLEIVRRGSSPFISSSSSASSSSWSSSSSSSSCSSSSSSAFSSSGSGMPCQRIFARVYRTSSEHFAVLFPIRAIVMTACRPLASLNLRSCSVEPLPTASPGTCPGREFRVSPRACEGVAVTFRALEGSSEVQMADWIRAFSDIPEGIGRRKKISDHRSPLPVLEESEEDLAE